MTIVRVTQTNPVLRVTRLDRVIRIKQSAPVLRVVIQDRIVRITLNETRSLHIKSVGPQGIPGAQGPPGPPGASVVSALAAETISALQIIYFDALGARVASALDFDEVASTVGIAVTAAPNPGDTFNYQVLGSLSDSGWAWNPGASLFLSDTGVLSESPGTNARIMGQAVTPTRINVNLLVAIRR